MALKEMYPGMINSPETTLTNGISESDTIIYVLDPARVPTPPNLMTLGTGTNAETVKVTAVNDNALTVERGFQGIAKSWPAGTVIARNFTEYDYQAMKENIEELDENLGDLAGEGRTTETVKGIADALDSHLAETAPHGATSEATANRLMLRDASGRVKFNSDTVLQNLGIAFYDAGISDYTTGQTIVSEKTLSNARLYLLFTSTGIHADSRTYGLYLVGFQGTQKNIIPILEDSGGISVSINADNKIEITNTSGSNRTLLFSLIGVR